ncbi:synaptonemal complex protein 1-like [Mytilus edulis]|uniref:synaptonemal complex protein 1-like n=1 Tax=Mytilus edulis TaxID=6550 RepID=UPI0039EEF33D
MAEGGYEFKIDDYDDDDYDDEEKTPLMDNDDEEFQNYINKEFENSKALSENDAKIRKKETIKKMIKQFYKKNGETTRNEVGFFVREDHNERQILYVKDEKGNNIALTYFKKGVLKFYKFSTLQKEYGVNFVRDVLGVDDYKISDYLKEGRSMFQDFQRTIKAPIRELDNIEIPLQEISTQQEGQELLETASNAETYVKEIETSFIEHGTSLVDNETQTKITKREMDGVISAMTTVKEELENNLAKLNETNKDLAKENAKLEQAKEDNDEFQIDRISSRIRELESERSARIETININREKLRSQLVRFKQTIHKMLNEDKTLGERIRTLFREQGITIVSVLTAFGMIIGVIAEAFTGSPAPSPSPPSKGGVQDWIKKQLKNLGKLLSFLAGKLAAALPGIIGSILSWLLTATKDVVNCC